MMLEVGIGEEYTREAVGLQDNQDLIFCKKQKFDRWCLDFCVLNKLVESCPTLHKLICGFHNMSWNSCYDIPPRLRPPHVFYDFWEKGLIWTAFRLVVDVAHFTH